MDFDKVAGIVGTLAALIRLAGSLADWVRGRTKERRAKHARPTRRK